jgi:SAM-dependent methyltransferase
MRNIKWIEENFTDLILAEKNIDVYSVRKSLFEAIKDHTKEFRGVLLDIGCGQMPYKEYILQNNNKVNKIIGLDLHNSSFHDTSIADLFWDGDIIPLSNMSVDSVMATEVLEHCFSPDQILSEIYRVLTPGGAFFFTVPFLWPLHETPYDAYRYTPFSLEKLLSKTGFKEIRISPLGGWHASMAQMLGLWAAESGLTGWKRKMIIKFSKFIIPILLKKDIKPEKFSQHTMITGLCGVCYK